MEPTILKQLREARMLTQTALAKLAGVARTTVSRVENGAQPPGEDYLRRCAPILGFVPLLARRDFRAELRSEHEWVRKAFATASESVTPPPLRMAFAAARQHPRGRKMVEDLDRQRRSAAQWWAIRQLAGQLYGSEQLFLLELLLRGGLVQCTSPSDVHLTQSYVQPPGHRWFALHLGPCIFFCQVTLALPYNPGLHVEARKSRNPRLDFLVAVATRPTLSLNVEVDGPQHAGRAQEDAARARAIGLPSVRFSVAELSLPNFGEVMEHRLRQSGGKGSGVVGGCDPQPGSHRRQLARRRAGGGAAGSHCGSCVPLPVRAGGALQAQRPAGLAFPVAITR